MLKFLITTASALTISFAATAQEATPLAGDNDYLAQAYAEAEDGRTFSYAGQWGNGRAYDGTDTSGMYRQAAPVAPAPRQPAPVMTASPVTRRVAPTPTRTQPQRFITQKQPPYQSSVPVAQAPRPIVNTIRTVTRPAPALRGTTTSARTVSRPAPAPRTRTYAAPQGRIPSPLGDLPRANPGECFARMKVPAQYDRVPEQVPVAAAYQRARVTQAQFSTDSKSVMVKDGYTKYVVTQPKFAVKYEQLVVKPAHDRLEVVPARFSYVSDTVQVSQPRLVWKRGAGLSGISRMDPRTGDTWCLVEEAGETKTIRKRVVSQPEQVRRVPIAAQTLSIPRQVLVQQGGIKQIEVPAQYRDFTVQRMLSPASSSTYDVPAETDTVMTKTLKSPERFEWVEVMCDTNSGPATIRSLQSALKSRGLYTGRVDGIMGPQTRSALVQFQRGAGIAHLGYLTTDSMAALGL